MLLKRQISRRGRVVICLLMAVFMAAALCLPASAVQNTQVGAGGNHFLFIKPDGSLWAWGDNSYGQLGNGQHGNGTGKDKPVKVMENVVAADGGRYHSLALKADGSVWAWGGNDFGQLGDGTNTDRSQPVKVLEGAQSISAGYYGSAAVKADGSLWTWGMNSLENGLGGGNVPQKIMEGVESYTTKSNRFYAIKTDGSLWAWGSNQHGELGNGKAAAQWNYPDNVYKPFKVMDDVKEVAPGGDHTLVLKKDGTVWAFGSNSAGQLGDGTVTDRIIKNINNDRLKPVKVMEGVKAIDAGWYHSLALKEDGTLWTWGSSRLSQREGNGSDLLTPRLILSDVTAMAAGNTEDTAVKKDGSLWFWHAEAVTGAAGSDKFTGEPEMLWKAAK